MRKTIKEATTGFSAMIALLGPSQIYRLGQLMMGGLTLMLRPNIRILRMGHTRPRQNGRPRHSLQSIDAIRVETRFVRRVREASIRIGNVTLASELPTDRLHAKEAPGVFCQLFNFWADFTGLPAGLHTIQFVFEHDSGHPSIRERKAWIDHTVHRSAMAMSPAIVAPDALAGGARVEDYVASLPSLTLSARRQPFEGPMKRILVCRVDQLGDTVLSIPAILSLRKEFPDAELYGLFSPAQVDLMNGIGAFTRVFSLGLPYDQSARRRYGRFGELRALRRQLLDLKLDVAIDLSTSHDTRPVLLLSGARHKVGFNHRHFPWLTLGLEQIVRDPGNGHSNVAHSHNPSTLVEAFVLAAKRAFNPLLREPMDDAMYKALGLPLGRRFAVLHSGARTATRKWPLESYTQLAEGIVRESGAFVVILLDDPDQPVDMPAGLDPDHCIVMRRKLSFDEFDGLLSQAAVVIGNDSGPKHLAALRGTPVVSIHMGAVNWSEWGQDGAGVIITRRVPCYGCGIELEEECGKGLPCLYGVTVDEVLAAALSEMRP